MFVEPVVDVLGCVWWPKEGSWVAVHFFNRYMPVFNIFAYACFVGGSTLYLFTRMERGLASKHLWGFYGLLAIINFILEILALDKGVFIYYGDQPFVFFGEPLWWNIVNPLMPITVAAVIYKLKPLLRGWKMLLVIPFVVMSDAAVNLAVGLPTQLALNSGLGLVATHIGALITLCLAILWAWVVSLAVAKDSPMNTGAFKSE